MAGGAFSEGLDGRQLVRRLLAHVAAVEGLGVSLAAPPRASTPSDASDDEDDVAASRDLLLAVQAILDRADQRNAHRRRSPALNWVEDELADEIVSQRTSADATQYDLDVALSRRLEALGIQPTELNVDIDPDAGDASLHSDQGPLAIAIGALAPRVGLGERTLWTGRARQEPPLTMVGDRYISGRVVRQLALEIAATESSSRNVSLSEFKRFDASANERMSDAAWKHMRGSMTTPALYSALLKTEGTAENWTGIRDRLQSQLQDAKLVVILATAILASHWSSTAANVPDPFFETVGADACARLLDTVHARKQEWAAVFLLSQLRAGQLTADESDFSASELEEFIDHLVTMRVTTEFAQRIDVALARAEAAGEV